MIRSTGDGGFGDVPCQKLVENFLRYYILFFSIILFSKRKGKFTVTLIKGNIFLQIGFLCPFSVLL